MKQLSKEARTFAGFLSVASVLIAFSRGCEMPVIPNIVTPTTGPKHVVILRETEDSTFAQEQLVNALRTGEEAKWLKGKGHKLDIWDDADVPLAQKLQAMGVQEPALFILDIDDDPLLHSKALPPEVSAGDVVKAIEQHGG